MVTEQETARWKPVRAALAVALVQLLASSDDARAAAPDAALVNIDACAV